MKKYCLLSSFHEQIGKSALVQWNQIYNHSTEKFHIKLYQGHILMRLTIYLASTNEKVYLKTAYIDNQNIMSKCKKWELSENQSIENEDNHGFFTIYSHMPFKKYNYSLSRIEWMACQWRRAIYNERQCLSSLMSLIHASRLKHKRAFRSSQNSISILKC